MLERAGVVPAETSATAEVVIETRGLQVSASGQSILRDVAFRVVRGEVTCVTGPSGVGKSTLLRCLNRLVDLIPGMNVAGDILFDGRSVYAPDQDPDVLREKIGMLFQQPVIFPGSLRDNVIFAARRLRKATRAEWDARIEAVLTEVGLWGEVASRLDAPAEVLSVGQQQRLCLARCLLVEPDVVLMDEPTSALDPESTDVIERLVCSRRGRQSFVVVTHDLAQARRIADHAVCISLHDGAGTLAPCAEPHPSLNDPACRDIVNPTGR